MAERLTKKQTTDFGEAFNIFDMDHDGMIAMHDLIPLMHILGHLPTVEELAELVATTEVHGFISISEFLDLMGGRVDQYSKEDEVRQAFVAFDQEETGFVPLVQIYLVLHEYDDVLTDDELEALLADSEVNESGFFKYEKVVEAISAKI